MKLFDDWWLLVKERSKLLALAPSVRYIKNHIHIGTLTKFILEGMLCMDSVLQQVLLDLHTFGGRSWRKRTSTSAAKEQPHPLSKKGSISRGRVVKDRRPRVRKIVEDKPASSVQCPAIADEEEVVPCFLDSCLFGAVVSGSLAAWRTAASYPWLVMFSWCLKHVLRLPSLAEDPRRRWVSSSSLCWEHR